MKDNPYYHRNRIPYDSPMFFGRCMEMDQLRRALTARNPQGVSVIGERRIGKSSLVWRIYHECRELPHMLAVWMDSHELDDAIDDLPSFYSFINEKLGKELERKGGTSDVSFSDFAGFKDFLEKNAEAGITFCLFIEEFEKLAGKEFAGASFLGNLRHLCDHEDYRFGCVTISMRPLRETQTAEQLGSDFGNNFDQITLGLLEDKPLAELRAYGFGKERLQEAELCRVHHLAGAFPLFNQIVLTHLFEAKKYGQSIDKAFTKACGELTRFYEDLWKKRSVEEQQALKALLKGKPVKSQLIDLKSRGLLIKDGDQLCCFSEWFSELVNGDLSFACEKGGWKSKIPAYGEIMKKLKTAFKQTGDAAREAGKTFDDVNKATEKAQKMGKKIVGLLPSEEETDEEQQ